MRFAPRSGGGDSANVRDEEPQRLRRRAPGGRPAAPLAPRQGRSAGRAWPRGPGAHLAVFAAQPVRAHRIRLQGARGGIAAETRTFLEAGRGRVGQGHTEKPGIESEHRALNDCARKKEPDSLAFEPKTRLAGDYLHL